MSEAVATEPLVTVAAFDEFLGSQSDDALWELVAGRIELEMLTHADDTLLFDALAFTITLDRIYFAVEPTNVHRLTG